MYKKYEAQARKEAKAAIYDDLKGVYTENESLRK